MTRLPVLPLAGLVLLAGAQALASASLDNQRRQIVLQHPCGTSGAHFGESTAVLDMNADGHLDVAVGAYGEGRVYVFFGDGSNQRRPSFTGVRLFDAGGPIDCSAAPATDRFGFDVQGGQLDADPGHELVVGAPLADSGGLVDAGAVYVIGLAGTSPVQLVAAQPEAGARLGNSVCVGDFDGDGFGDVAAGARLEDVQGIDAGRVHVFFGPFNGGPASELVLDNPAPVQWGNFGHHLAVGDTNRDGIDDLVLSATGNSASGIAVAGQVYCYPGPLSPGVFQVLEDPHPDPLDLPAPRFGMHVDARGPWVMVGANRKDWSAIHDVGMGFVFRGPALPAPSLHEAPSPAQDFDYMGFRCAVADVVGDAALDFTFVVMPNQNFANPNPLALVTWDGNDRFGTPARILRAIPRSGDHFGNGLSYGQLVTGGHEELVVGDPTYDAPGAGAMDDTGRVVVYF